MQQPKRILLIDDDHDHLLICNLILQKRGYQVKTMDGCEKMEDLNHAVQTFVPDLIFMDHDMKGICGMDLTRMLKSHSTFARIPVIYFTSRDNIAQLAKEAGADGYFKKPFEVNGLMEITARYLQ
jgi:CheY-like chemotaxis protein